MLSGFFLFKLPYRMNKARPAYQGLYLSPCAAITGQLPAISALPGIITLDDDYST